MTLAEVQNQVTRRRMPNGQMKEKILGALSTAGASGMTVKELAVALSVKPANIYAWFFNVGKQIPEIKEIGRGKYRFEKLPQHLSTSENERVA